MPTYEYVCRDCGEHLEVVQSFTEEALTQCGRCGGNLRKVFSAAGIIFKGSGYYVTDSRAKASGEADSGSSSESSSDSSSDTSKSTSKKSESTDDSSAKSA